MFTLKMTTFTVLASVAAVTLTANVALAGGDAFNRKTLGATWQVVAPSMAINSTGQLTGSSLSLGSFTGGSANNAGSVVVNLTGTGLQYGAIALGNVAGGNNAFIKIQQQNGAGTFDHGAFYTGNNGSGTFFALTTPATSPAVLDAYFCGTTAVMRIVAANGVQTYTNNYGATYGNGAGLGIYGSTTLDNFETYTSAKCTVTASELPAAMTATASQDADKSK